MPGSILATTIPLPHAIGTSWVVVSALGLRTTLSCATAGLVDWKLTGLLVAGEICGTITGLALVKILGPHRRLLESGFAVIVVTVGTYVLTTST